MERRNSQVETANQKLRRIITNTRRYYQYILSTALITLVILVIYGRDFEILANEALQNEALSHILLIPFFAGLLFYLKRDTVKAFLGLDKLRKKPKTRHIDELVGVILLLIAFLTYWYGSYTFYPLEYHVLSLPIFITGLILILFNLKTALTLAIPTLFLLFLIPMPTQLIYTIGGYMANTNTLASYNILRAFNLPVSLTTDYGPPILNLTDATGQSIPFTIGLACSGIYSVIAFAMFATFLAIIITAPVWKKTLIFLIGFAVFDVLNIIRITTVVGIAYPFGEETAMSLFHPTAGLILIFVGMLLILFTSEKLLKIQIFPQTPKPAPCPACKTTAETLEDFCTNCGRFLNPTRLKLSQTLWAKLFLLLIGCTIVTMSINAPTFAVAQGLIEITANPNGQSVTSILPNVTGYYQPRYLYRDSLYEQVARIDASLTYGYVSENFTKPIVLIIIGVSSSISNLHNWEVCLVSWQTAQGQFPLVQVLDQRDTQLIEDTPLIARYIVFKSPYNYTQTTLYWYEKASFNTGITVEQKYVRISLLIITPDSTNYQQHEQELQTIGTEIAKYWEPLKTQALISLGIPAQQMLLAVSIGFVAVTETAQISNDLRKKTNNRKLFSKYASPKEKAILQTITELAKSKKTFETREIGEAVKTQTGKTVKPETLLEILNRLEEYGYIQKTVLSTNGQPKLVWKSKY